jgi:hypothetical protein
VKRTPLAQQGTSDTALIKDDIQHWAREIVILRDGDCILKKYRHCDDPVKQADHLITRANSATYADTRLIVCLCRSCHGWKHWHKEEYDALVKNYPATRPREALGRMRGRAMEANPYYAV